MGVCIVILRIQRLPGVCRVQGPSCYSQDFGEGLRDHLQTHEHLASIFDSEYSFQPWHLTPFQVYDASLAAQLTTSEQVSTAEQTPDRQT